MNENGRVREQESQYREAERVALSRYVQRCVDSGGVLTRSGNAGTARLSCSMCDCFGYHPNADGRAVQSPASWDLSS